ncbi:MAG: chromate transporter [Alistipes sp.]|nr:chromate transporter [Alistipes sp.]MBQ5924025.1 chromate transporter [Alistipes sp.]
MSQLFEIFWSFLKIGAFTFGGGYAMIPLIQHEVIHRRGWLSEQEFIELLTIAQTAPGPISLNTAVFVGYKYRRYWGALAAVTGVVIPSFVIILFIAIFFAGIRNNIWVDAAFKGMRPAVVALIVAPIVGLTKGMHWRGVSIALATAVVVWYFGFSPIWLLIAGAIGGVLWYARRGEEAEL